MSWIFHCKKCVDKVWSIKSEVLDGNMKVIRICEPCAAPRIGLSSFERNIDLSYIVGLYIVMWRCLDSREDRGCRRSLCFPVFSDPLSAPQHQKLPDGHRHRVCRLWESLFHNILYHNSQISFLMLIAKIFIFSS